MDRNILIPGDVPAQTKTEKSQRKFQTIQKFQKSTLRKKLSSEDFIQIGNAILQISLFVTLIIVVAVCAHFKVQNELMADEQAKAIEKLLGNKTRNCNPYGKLCPCHRTDIIGIINDRSKDFAYGPNNVLLDKTDFS